MSQKIESVKTIGMLIRGKRKSQQLTQDDLASVCGVGIRFIRELEQGKVSCQIEKTLLVMRMLGLTLIVQDECAL